MADWSTVSDPGERGQEGNHNTFCNLIFQVPPAASTLLYLLEANYQVQSTSRGGALPPPLEGKNIKGCVQVFLSHHTGILSCALGKENSRTYQDPLKSWSPVFLEGSGIGAAKGALVLLCHLLAVQLRVNC